MVTLFLARNGVQDSAYCQRARCLRWNLIAALVWPVMGVLVHDVYNSTKPNSSFPGRFHIYRITIYSEELLESLPSVGLVRTNHVRDVASPMFSKPRFAFCTHLDHLRSKHWRPDFRGGRATEGNMEIRRRSAWSRAIEEEGKLGGTTSQESFGQYYFTVPKSLRSSLRAFTYGDDRWVLEFPLSCDAVKLDADLVCLSHLLQ